MAVFLSVLLEVVSFNGLFVIMSCSPTLYACKYKMCCWWCHSLSMSWRSTIRLSSLRTIS